MTFNQIFDEMFQRTRDSAESFLCEMLVRTLGQKMQQAYGRGILDVELSSGHNFQGFWNFVVDVLMIEGCTLADIENDPVWEEATKVAEILREILARETGESFSKARIMSPSQMMVEDGLATLVPGPDGQTMVKLTKEGERVAREFIKEGEQK